MTDGKSVKLDLTPRLECVLCGASFERTPADEHDVGAMGQSATGLCSGCGTDHPREFVRFWRLGFRDYIKEQARRHKGRDVPGHLTHAYDVGWAAAETCSHRCFDTPGNSDDALSKGTDAILSALGLPVRCLSTFRGVQCAHGDGHSGSHEYVEAF